MPNNDNDTRRTTAALFAAAATAATLFIIYSIWKGQAELDFRSFWAWILAFIVAIGHASLGLLVYPFLKRRNLIRWWISVICGFLVGFLPLAIITSPWLTSSRSSWSIEGIPQVINGVTTKAGWSSYFEMTLSAGLLGMFGGLAAWIVWRALKPTMKDNSKDYKNISKDTEPRAID